MKKIMIVEDDVAIREVFGLMLKRAGFEVVLLPDGELLLSDPFDEPHLFIIDKQLPGPDGLEICRFLKSRPKLSETPVLIFSAGILGEKQAKQNGADGFLAKPVAMKYLLENVRKYTEKAETGGNEVEEREGGNKR